MMMVFSFRWVVFILLSIDSFECWTVTVGVLRRCEWEEEMYSKTASYNALQIFQVQVEAAPLMSVLRSVLQEEHWIQ